MPDTDHVTATSDELALATLKADLNRTGNFPADNDYLSGLLSASRNWLALNGVPDDGGPLYLQILVARAAHIYRSRVTGKAEPAFLRRMLNDYKLSRRMELT